MIEHDHEDDDEFHNREGGKRRSSLPSSRKNSQDEHKIELAHGHSHLQNDKNENEQNIDHSHDHQHDHSHDHQHDNELNVPLLKIDHEKHERIMKHADSTRMPTDHADDLHLKKAMSNKDIIQEEDDNESNEDAYNNLRAKPIPSKKQSENDTIHNQLGKALNGPNKYKSELLPKHKEIKLQDQKTEVQQLRVIKSMEEENSDEDEEAFKTVISNKGQFTSFLQVRNISNLILT